MTVRDPAKWHCTRCGQFLDPKLAEVAEQAHAALCAKVGAPMGRLLHVCALTTVITGPPVMNRT